MSSSNAIRITKDRSKVRFDTEIKKNAHKFVSKLRVGRTYEYSVGDNDPNEVMIAIKESIFYNNMDAKTRWASNQKKSILISVEY